MSPQAILRFFGLCMVLVWAQAVHAANVVIVSSDTSAGFTEVVTAATTELVRTGIPLSEIRTLGLAQANDADLRVGGSPIVVVTLGTAALKQVLALNQAAPIVAALLPRSSFERVLKEFDKRPAGPVAGLFLDQPLGRQLSLLKLAFPATKRVGVLFGPESVLLQPAVTQAANARGLSVVSGIVTADGPLSGAVRAVVDEADALLALPDPAVYNSATISNVLLSTYHAHIPMLAFSPAYVKAGAVLALHTTPTQIGNQLAELAGAALHGRALAASQSPKEFVVSVNAYVAKSMGINLDEAILAAQLRRLEKDQ